ncbi:hypothetical protein L204_101941 [Cryptococcus depauperatus]
MTEYWISKKQYWCKYCNIWIRDDAPSRRQHETGLKHTGNRERFIRDLYRGGEKAKKEKAQEVAEMARIEAAAQAAHAHDTLAGLSRPSSSVSLAVTAPCAPPARLNRPRDTKPTDKWANYSTAAQLGFVDPDVEKSSYDVQQELKNSVGEPGQWEEVAAPSINVNGEGRSNEIAGNKREREEDGTNEGWRFDHKGKKPIHDPYDDDFDPTSLKLLKIKKKGKDKGIKNLAVDPSSAPEAMQGLKREGWSGKLVLEPAVKTEGNQVFTSASDEIKIEGQDNPVKHENGEDKAGKEDVKPTEAALTEENTVEKEAEAEVNVKFGVSELSVPESTAPGGGSMFKK